MNIILYTTGFQDLRAEIVYNVARSKIKNYGSGTLKQDIGEKMIKGIKKTD